MTPLTEFLREQATKQRSQAGQREARRVEWVQSVERLIEQLKEWVHQADPEGVLRVTCQPHSANEAGLGRYEAPGLTMELEGRKVQVLPVARNVVGSIGDPSFRAQGLVEITDGAFRYLLYRAVDDRGERWIIVNDQDYSVKPLERMTLEAALVSLFE